ncbi:MAG: universal stress protein [Bacteroidota bacterium]
MNKILCPLDFSETSLNAIEFAVEIGKKFHSTITLFHVFTEQDFNRVVGREHVGKSFKELLGVATGKLKVMTDDINERCKPEGIDHCEYKIELGELIDSLATTMENDHYDLIVMGTTGISRTNGIFFGSNTEEVIDKVKKPILCIPEQCNFTSFSKLVYASDFIKEDKIAIQEVISFATMFDSRINVLHINHNEDNEAYKKFITELKSFIQYDKIGFVNKNFKDEVGLGIQEYMDQENSDLLVVFKQQRGFVESIFHKSITKTLSHSSEKPLLILKSR